MDTSYDYKKFAILYVDDEEMSLKLFTRAYADEFGFDRKQRAGLKLLEQPATVGLLLTDQRMPGGRVVARARPPVDRALSASW